MARMLSTVLMAVAFGSMSLTSAAANPFAVEAAPRKLQAGNAAEHSKFCDGKLTEISGSLNTACCSGTSACGAGGIPSRCSGTCAAVYLPFYKVCSSYVKLRFPGWTQFSTSCESAAYGYFGRCWSVDTIYKNTVASICKTASATDWPKTCPMSQKGVTAQGQAITCPEAYEDFYFKCRVQIEEKSSAEDKTWYMDFLQKCQTATNTTVAIAMDPCAGTAGQPAPCKNGATCIKNGIEKFTCDCMAGWVGRLCDLEYKSSATDTSLACTDPFDARVKAEVRIDLITNAVDSSGNNKLLTRKGGVSATPSPHGGLNFSHVDDYGLIASSQGVGYANDGRFSVGFWMTEHACTKRSYEFVYRHAHSSSMKSSHIDAYVACSARLNGEIWTVIRFDLKDTAGNRVMFDYPMHETHSFTATTELWKHVILSVSNTAVELFVNGVRVVDSEFFFEPKKSNEQINMGYPHLGELNYPWLGTFELGSQDIYIGGQDQDSRHRHDFHYRGKVAGIYLSAVPMTATVAKCLFDSLSKFLPTSADTCETIPQASLSVGFMGSGTSAYEDLSESGNPVKLLGGAKTSVGGVHFDGDGDFVQISLDSFKSPGKYADDGKFSISFWFTKETCTSGNYEYMYSHVQDENLNIFESTNSNVNIYLGCESNKGGWSTAAGTVVRYNVMDSFGTWATMDYEIHDAGDFDTITNKWVHVTLVSTGDNLKTFADGVLVPDDDYEFYSQAMTDTNNAYTCSDDVAPGPYDVCVAPQKTSKLTKALRGFSLPAKVVVGARADRHKDRHFEGRMAMLNIFDKDISDVQANCLFADGDARLPEPAASTCLAALVDALLIKPDTTTGSSDTTGLEDRSGADHHLTMFGGKITAKGAQFGGDGDYIKLNARNLNYAGNAQTRSFSVQFWMTKEDCVAGNKYEYMYSHNQQPNGDIEPLAGGTSSNSNVNIYMACEQSGGGWSTFSGSVIRYNLVDNDGNWVQFDYPLHDAGHFDAITNEWVQVTLAVEAERVMTFDDGKLVPDSEYYYYVGAMGARNLAYSHPGALTSALSQFTLGNDIYIGGRTDLSTTRHFKGMIAGLMIVDHALSDSEVSCLFLRGEEELPQPAADSAYTVAKCDAKTLKPVAVATFLDAGTPVDVSGHTPAAKIVVQSPKKSKVLGVTGARFDDQGDQILVTADEYGTTGSFTISFWMTKADCTPHAYEYLYSHHKSSNSSTMFQSTYVDAYLACEQTELNAAAGWSTLGGAIIRYWVRDDAGTEAMVDSPLHAAGDFDTITAKWVHIVLTVSNNALISYDDGVAIPDATYGYYGFAGTKNVANPKPSALSTSLGAFTFAKASVVLGSRADIPKNRHFVGSMALVAIIPSAITAGQAKCLFEMGDAVLPEPRSSPCAALDLDVRFVGDAVDRSVNAHKVTPVAHATVNGDGAHFDGAGDYFTIPTFSYADDGAFTVAFWMTKEDCTTNVYEYLYSHAQVVSGTIDQQVAGNSNVNIYLSCETSGAGWSTMSGSVVRFNAMDVTGRWAQFDYPLHDAGHFDEVTNLWSHTVMVVNPLGITTFNDGSLVPDSEYGFYVGSMKSSNLAYSHPGVFTGDAFSSFSLSSDIHIGSRSDKNANRNFVGRMAGLQVSSRDLTHTEVKCLFDSGELYLPAQWSPCAKAPPAILDVSFLGVDTDTHSLVAANNHAVSMCGGTSGSCGVKVGVNGASFNGKGDYVTVENFLYADDSQFTISFWMTKQDCTGGVYEYMYSHHYDNTVDRAFDHPYVDMYLACEGSGGGWSTLDGSQIRFWLRDTSGSEAMVDYPLHSAGDFDSVTEKWMHVILAVNRDSLVTFDDGKIVEDSAYGYYGFANKNANLADPSPSKLKKQFSSFDLRQDIVLGGRADLHSDRHFMGKLALLKIFNGPVTVEQATCLFNGGDASLPNPLAHPCVAASSDAKEGTQLDVAFIEDLKDRSGKNREVIKKGHTLVDSSGVHFDGAGDYIAISSFDYATDAKFSVSFWMTKEDCTTKTYEYLYSHNRIASGSITDGSNSNVNIYISCETSGGGWSTHQGSVIRYNLADNMNNWGQFDYPLHDAGNFDAITNTWIHVVLAVSPQRTSTYDDGEMVADADYGFYVGSMGSNNVAYTHPGAVSSEFKGFTLNTDIIVGGRADLNKDRHFVGRMAGLMITGRYLTQAEVTCTFKHGEEFLPQQYQLMAVETVNGESVEVDACKTIPAPLMNVPLLIDAVDYSDNGPGGKGYKVTTFGNAVVGATGASFGGDADYITIANFDYAADASFTISFWMTKAECTGGVYEYLYSHHGSAGTDAWDKAYVDAYLACEQTDANAAAGWSTLGGSVLRYWLQDDAKTEAMVDFPLHDAGDFDSITEKWVHVIIAVKKNSLVTYDDGERIEDSAYGFYGLQASKNHAKPTPSSLSKAFTSFTLATDIHIGTRVDKNNNRHFVGQIALVSVFEATLNDQQAKCMFRHGDSMLPEPLSSKCTSAVLDARLVGDYVDRSPSNHNITLGGHTQVNADGAHFDGEGDFISINNFDYSSDGSFSVSFWMTKEDCTTSVYEYLYSHNKVGTGSITDGSNSNVNVYMSCETSGGGWSTFGGTVLRYNLVDKDSHWAQFDYPLHDAGNFDSITNTWIHVVLAVSPQRVVTYDDGALVEDGSYGFYVGAMGARNLAYTHPGAVSNTFTGFDLKTNIVLGGRADYNQQRHFVGRMAGLMVSGKFLDKEEVECMFMSGEGYLPASPNTCETPLPTLLSVSMLNSIADNSGRAVPATVTKQGSTTIGSTGAKFTSASDRITIKGAPEYGRDNSFTISFWMSKIDCADGLYEYMYSHHESSNADLTWQRSYIDMYLACEQSGGGWSTLGGSVIRFWMRDRADTEAMVDYSLHGAGDFDAITEKWVHVILAVDAGSMVTYDDGVLVKDTDYGFYGFGGESSANVATPTPSTLKKTMVGFDLRDSDIVIGGRADAAKDRRFRGGLALLNIYEAKVNAVQAKCIFLSGDQLLPHPQSTACVKNTGNNMLDARLVKDLTDRSGKGHAVKLAGHASVTSNGVAFDGDGDLATIEFFDYFHDGSFTISFWMTKEDCTTNKYEYLYSHGKTPIDTGANSNVNIYLACETSGGGWSTFGGSVIRYNVVDGNQHWAQFDYPLHDAGNFDAVTNRWVHIALAVGPSTLKTFDDGNAVRDTDYGFYVGAMGTKNIAYSHPGLPSKTMSHFQFDGKIFLGARSDAHANRHFVGEMAGLNVAKGMLSDGEMRCLFDSGETYLPSKALNTTCGSIPGSLLTVSLLKDKTDTSGHGRIITAHGDAKLSATGAVFGGQGDYLTVPNFEYATDSTFTISFWMTKADCTGGVYEYMYSHHNSSGTNQWTTAYVDAYLACEQGTGAAAGWSTLSGSVLRYWLQDDDQTQAMVDFQLHDSGDFDSITEKWVHVVIAVGKTSLVTYEDGVKVPDSMYGFYGPLEAAKNHAQPTPSSLSKAFTSFSLGTDIFIGARVDLNEDRHFKGQIALVNIYEAQIRDDQAKCLFSAGDVTLPEPLSHQCATLDVDIKFVGDTKDRSKNGLTVTAVGHATVDGDGAHFDGAGDSFSIGGGSALDYASDASFSVSFWVTKEDCTTQVYEYLYSHNQDAAASITDGGSSNVNIYLACETSGSGWSTHSGSVIRYNLVDARKQWAQFDYPLHAAGDFDAITNVWMAVVMVVTPYRITTYDDGQPVTDDTYAYYVGGMGQRNIAYSHPAALTSALTNFDVKGKPIVLGGRSDLHSDRFFVGRMASLMVSKEPFTPEQVECIFNAGETILPSRISGSVCDMIPPPSLEVSFIMNQDDTSVNKNTVTLHQNAVVHATGIEFLGAGDYATVSIAKNSYATDAQFTISFWMSKVECSSGVYEYLYSHHGTKVAANTWTKAYTDIFVACEESGSGWSTKSGSVVRYWLRDEAGTEATMDFPIHDAGDFDAITAKWMHVVLVVQPSAIKTYLDGEFVPDKEYGFYSFGAEAGKNAAYPKPSALGRPLTGFTLETLITLGGRADLDKDRHFLGKMALLAVYDGPLRSNQAKCIFRAGDATIPDSLASTCTKHLDLDVRFINDALDRSSNKAKTVVKLDHAGNHAMVDKDGVHFDGDGDYVEITGVSDYAKDGVFSISFWMTKEDCTTSMYEYVYSHANDPAKPVTDPNNSNINMYLACETSGGGWSTFTGSIIRFNVVDKAGTWAQFDYPLHSAGGFDSITNVWMHTTFIATQTGLYTYDDGQPVSDSEYGYYVGSMALNNAAYSHPGRVQGTSAFSGYDLTSSIILGGRADFDKERHFVGRMAGVQISDKMLTPWDVKCMFDAGEGYLPSVPDGKDATCHKMPPTLMTLPLLNGQMTDTSDYGRVVTKTSGVTIGATGAKFSGKGDFITVATFGYAADSSFTISFWMTKSECTGGVYEYLYSHHRDTSFANAYVDAYIACEESGTGWSTLDGSVLRYWLQDDAKTQAQVDFPLHDAGDFDMITEKWVHVVLTVSPSALKTYDDGQLVADSVYGSYKHLTGTNAAFTNGAPKPSALATAFTSFTLATDITIGARVDANSDRHFVGQIALVNVFEAPLSDAQVKCLFEVGDAMLPEPLSSSCVKLDLDVMLVGKDDLSDRSGHGHTAKIGGHAMVDADGAHFDGEDDDIEFITDANFNYAQDGTFSVSFWMTKEDCTANAYEYLYSHSKDPKADIMGAAPGNSNVNIYLACESGGGGFSSLGTSVIRYNVQDEAGKWGQFDYALHNAGSFDTITSVWIQVVFVVSNYELSTYNDGKSVGSSNYGFYAGAMKATNKAYPEPGQLTAPLGAFDLAGKSIIIGARSDRNHNRAFVGRMAGIKVLSRPFSAAEVNCIFKESETFLPVKALTCANMPAAKIDVSFLNDQTDVSGNNIGVTLVQKTTLNADGVRFNGDGDHVKIPNFEYATESDYGKQNDYSFHGNEIAHGTSKLRFTISFWMAKEECTTNMYEYLYSHDGGASNDIFDLANSNINIFLGCEEAGGGFSSVASGGSVLRYNLIDGSKTWVQIDYPLHKAGDFDSITNQWVHVMLVAEYDSVKTYADGVLVPDTMYGTYSNARKAGNAAYRPGVGSAKSTVTPSTLTQPLRAFSLKSDIILGGRTDLNQARHFKGQMALLRVWSTSLNAVFARCVFSDGDIALPEPKQTICHKKGVLDLDVSLIGDTVDRSDSPHKVTLKGNTSVGAMGARFDGQGDAVTISNFEYADDGVFSISFWMTKETCTDSSYEYLYSHSQQKGGNILGGDISNINIYLGCEKNGGAYSDAESSVVRFNLVDTAKNHATFDWALHDAGDFDSLTNAWVNLVLVVNKTSIFTYEDGMKVDDSSYYYFGDKTKNTASNGPSSLKTPFSAFNLNTDIVLGGRTDANQYRSFVGKIANVEISTKAFTHSDVLCSFKHGESVLPTMQAMCASSRKSDLTVSFLNDATDSSNEASTSNVARVPLVTTKHGNALVSASGVAFKTAADYYTIQNFPYANDGAFTISFWMTKEKCSDNTFEYVYSHAKSATGNIIKGGDSNVNYYWGCEANGGGFSTFGGSVLRLNYLDSIGTHATADVPMHSAGDFDSITNKWVHLVTVVNKGSLQTYLDGTLLVDKSYGHHQGATDASNVAYPNPSKFSKNLGAFDLKTDIFIGQRTDMATKDGTTNYRNFVGSVALLQIWAKPISLEEARCVFLQGDISLPAKKATSCTACTKCVTGCTPCWNGSSKVTVGGKACSICELTKCSHCKPCFKGAAGAPTGAPTGATGGKGGKN